MFDSTMNKANKGFLLVMALSTRVLPIQRLFSLPFPSLILRGLGGGKGAIVRPCHLNLMA